MPSDKEPIESFTQFVEEVEPRLKRALVTALGAENGREAAAEALAYGWEQWDRVRVMENPAGYLYRVGKSRATVSRRHRPLFPEPAVAELPEVEPGLVHALGGLTERQRTAVMLVFGYGWRYSEAAEVLEVSPGTVEKHAQRGLEKLRTALEVQVGA